MEFWWWYFAIIVTAIFVLAIVRNLPRDDEPDDDEEFSGGRLMGKIEQIESDEDEPIDRTAMWLGILLAVPIFIYTQITQIEQVANEDLSARFA